MFIEKESKLGKYTDTLFYYKQKFVNWNFIADSGSIDVVLLDFVDFGNVHFSNASVAIQQVDGLTLTAEKFLKVIEGTSNCTFVTSLLVEIESTDCSPESVVTIKKINFFNPMLKTNMNHTENLSVELSSLANKFFHLEKIERPLSSIMDLDILKSDESIVTLQYSKFPNCSDSELKIAPLPTVTKYLFEDENICAKSEITANILDGYLTLQQNYFIFVVPAVIEEITTEKVAENVPGIHNSMSIAISNELLRIEAITDNFTILYDSEPTNAKSTTSSMSLVESLTLY